MSQPAKPKSPYSAVRELCTPSIRDRQRVGSAIKQAIVRGQVSPTVVRVDADMARTELALSAEAALSVVAPHRQPAALSAKIAGALAVGGAMAFWGWQSAAHNAGAADLQARPAARAVSPAPMGPGPDRDWQATTHAVVPEAAPARPAAHRSALHAAGDLAANHPHRTHAETREDRSALEALDTAPPERHHLAEELRLMRVASDALEDGQESAALRALSEHETRFPAGALAHERSALRVIALCQQEPGPHALAERERFLTLHPQSPLAARVREACKQAP